VLLPDVPAGPHSFSAGLAAPCFSLLGPLLLIRFDGVLRSQAISVVLFVPDVEPRVEPLGPALVPDFSVVSAPLV